MARFVLTAELSLQAPRNVAQVVQQIQSQLNGIQVNVQVQGARQAQRDVEQLARSADRANDSFFRMGRTFTASVRRFSALAIATRAVSLLTNTLSNAIEEAISFQKEVVRLSQVTGDSISKLSRLTDEITNLATTLGVSSDKLLSVTTILAQAGLSAEETRIALSALAKTELAPTFGNITETAEGAVAILAQFKLGAGALEEQLGSLNAVSGKFAVESGDLIETIRRTGGVFKAAGGDLNELIALFTSVRATTRESAATIATGLRTIFTRIQRPATIEYLKQFGIELTDLEGKFVGPYEAIRLLSEALSGLEEGDITFVQIAEQLGGFRQIGKVIPLLQEFATAQQALKVAQEGAGSLAKDQATAQLALAVQITKVKEEFFALVRGFTETSTFRAMADVILKLASTFIRLAEAIQPILPILTAFAGIRLAQGIGGLIGGVLGRARGMSQGGKVLAFAKGGLVPGSGSGTADDVPAMLSSGEFVMKESAVRRIGVDNLKAMNKGGIVVDPTQIGGFFLRPEEGVDRTSFPISGNVNITNPKALRLLGQKTPISEQRQSAFDNLTKDKQAKLLGITSIKGSKIASKSIFNNQGQLDISSKSARNALRNSGVDPDTIDKDKANRLLNKNIESGKFQISGKNIPISGSIGSYFPGKQDLQQNAKVASKVAENTQKGLFNTILKTIDPVVSMFNNPAIAPNKSQSRSGAKRIANDANARATTEGFVFEGLIQSITGAKLAGGQANFDYPQKSISTARESLKAMFTDSSGEGIDTLIKADAKRSNTPDAVNSITNKIKNDINKGDLSGVSFQKFAIGGRAKGIQDAPLVDDILQASGSILPRPSAAIQALISAGGGAVDIDRTLKRTVGDIAYAKAPTPEAKNASLDTYFRDEAKRLEDLKSAKITQFGKELQAAIKSRQLDGRRVSIISKSKRVKGAAEYLSSQFGIPIQNMIFTQGGSKQPAIDAIRTKGSRVDRVKKHLGGLIQTFATGGKADPKDTLEQYFADSSAINLGLSDSKNLGKDQRQQLASNVKDLRKLRTPAPATLYSSISRVAFDRFASQVGFNKNPKIPEGTSYFDKQKFLDQEARKTVGKSFSLPGFVSTSKEIGKAKLFLDNGPRSEDNWAAMLTIATKRDAQGVDVAQQLSGRQMNLTKQDINPRTGKMETMYMNPPSSEQEVILQPRSRFKINSAKAVQLGANKNLWANVQQFASGGVVPGIGNRDTVPAMLNEGDFVIRKSSTKNIGTDVLSSMAGYASGGNVSKQVPALLTPGEFVFSKQQAQGIGYGKLNRMNKVGKYANGGYVGFRKFFRGGVAEKDIHRAQGEIIIDVSQAESVFENLISQLPASIGNVILDSFKGVQALQPGEAQTLVQTNKPVEAFKETTRGQAVGTRDKSGRLLESGIGLQLQGTKVAATEETVAHETGHIADIALGKGGKGLASEQRGTFQFELVEKVKPQMEAAFKAAGVDADRIKEYLSSNKELFAEFFAKASPEVRAIITSTTDAATGMRMLADHLGDTGYTYAGLEASDLDVPKPSATTAPPQTKASPTRKPSATSGMPPTPPDDTNTYIKNMAQAVKERTQTLIQSKVEESRLNAEVKKQANLITQLQAQSAAGQKVSGELRQAHDREKELKKQQEAAIQASLKAEERLTAAQKRKEELILQARSEKQAAAESRKATLKGGVPSTFATSTVGQIQAEQDRSRQTQSGSEKSSKETQVTDRSAQLATALAAAGTALGYFQTEITENSSSLAIFSNQALSTVQSITLLIAALQAFGVNLSQASIAKNLDTLSNKFPAFGKLLNKTGLSTEAFAGGLQAGAIATIATVGALNAFTKTLQESARLEKERQAKLALASEFGSEEQKRAVDKSNKAAAYEAGTGVRGTFGTVGGYIGGAIGSIAGLVIGGTVGAGAGGVGAVPGAAIGAGVGGTAGATTGYGLGAGFADLLGYTEEAAILAAAQNNIAVSKQIADKEMAKASKEASKALKDFQDGTATAADVLKSTEVAGQGVAMQIEATKKANEAEQGLANQSTNLRAWMTLGYSDSRAEKQTKADENAKIRNEELKKAVDDYIEMNQAGTSALARANTASGQSFDQFFNNLRSSNAPLADAYASSEENLNRLRKEFDNLSKEAEKTRAAFEAINLGFQSVNATASALTVGLDNYLAAQEAGNIGLAQSINTLQAGLTNAAQGISTETFQAALTDAEAALVSMGASQPQVDKFKENMSAINTAQKFYATATEEAKQNLQAEFQRGAGGTSNPEKRQEALANALVSQMDGVDDAVKARVKDALMGMEIKDEDLTKILDGNFEVLDKVLQNLGEKTFGQVNKALEQYVKYQQQLVKLTQERIKIEGQLRDAQKSTIDATLEAAKIAQEFGGAAVTPDQTRQSIIAKANVDAGGLGVGELKTGSAEEIKARQANIRQALAEQKTIVTAAAAGDKGAQQALQGQAGAERAANTERLQKLAQENYNTTKALIDQKREEIKLIQSKNQLEKDSMDALISGDIMKFFESQAAVGAQAALATGDQQLISQFDTATLGAATKDLERQREAGVQQRFGRDVGGAGGLIEGGFAAIGGRVGLGMETAQAAAQTTPEQLQAEKEARELAATLPENMAILEMAATKDLEAADKQLQAAEKQLEAAKGEVEKSAQGPDKPQQAGVRSRGGMIYASRGTFVNFKPKGTDTVPAMLTPGEFVVNRQSVQRGNNLAILTAMNKGQSAPAATGMAKGGSVKYMQTGGIATSNPGSSVSINIDVKALQAFSASLSKFNDDLAANIQNLKDTKFQVSLSPTNINVNLTGTSFLEQLTSSLKQELISYVGKEISQYSVGSDGKLKKSGSTLGTGL